MEIDEDTMLERDLDADQNVLTARAALEAELQSERADAFTLTPLFEGYRNAIVSCIGEDHFMSTGTNLGSHEKLLREARVKIDN